LYVINNVSETDSPIAHQSQISIGGHLTRSPDLPIRSTLSDWLNSRPHLSKFAIQT